MENENKQEYISQEEAFTIKEMFKKYLQDYKQKSPEMSDSEWLEILFAKELPEQTREQSKQDAQEITSAIKIFDSNLKEINESATRGIGKEEWLANKIQQAATGMSVQEYGKTLQIMDNALAEKNFQLHDALLRDADKQIKMSRNLDGNIAEHMIAKTAELSADIQGKNVKVQVLDSFGSNSVDVRAVNMDTGKYQNYQLKFGKDAKATIDLIERGNYNNQRIIVPSEQLEEVQAHFKAKGSNKTITDHIDAWGAEGKSFTKDEMKKLQTQLQEDGLMPSMDYNAYRNKDLAVSIGKNAGVMALQSAAITTGLNIATKVFKGEKIDSDELVETALKTGADTSVKVVAAGTLQVAIRKGVIKCFARNTPAGVIANIASVGIENVKVIYKIATGELSLTKGVEQMGRVSVSMVAGLACFGKGAAIGAAMTGWIPVIGPPLAVVTGCIGGMVGYFAGSKIGETIYNAGVKIASSAKTIAKSAYDTLRDVRSSIRSGIKSLGSRLLGALGF